MNLLVMSSAMSEAIVPPSFGEHERLPKDQMINYSCDVRVGQTARKRGAHHLH